MPTLIFIFRTSVSRFPSTDKRDQDERDMEFAPSSTPYRRDERDLGYISYIRDKRDQGNAPKSTTFRRDER